MSNLASKLDMNVLLAKNPVINSKFIKLNAKFLTVSYPGTSILDVTDLLEEVKNTPTFSVDNCLIDSIININNCYFT
ncbi:hypothetical protein [Methanosarcina sp. UBA411]|uniref:hypothetical protein n=1 Tax=Methanosarcina sp. UBA411 TaxID=1915589 RepID=UPI0025FE79AD|nr:hypothetical protein [Methanosarcina sp. UBA411]